MQNQDINFTVENSIWGKDIKFTEQGSVVLQNLVHLQEKLLDFLRNENIINIKNSEVSEIYQQIFDCKHGNEHQFKEFFMKNVEGFSQEMSDSVQYDDDDTYSKNVGKRWVSIKQFLFWIGYFFACCYLTSKTHEMYGTAFNKIIKPLFFDQHQHNLLKCICNLLDKERDTRSGENPNIHHLIQMFLVCGIDKLVIRKRTEKNLIDPLIYISQEDDIQKSNPFYEENFQKQYRLHLQKIYREFIQEWQSQNNTISYINDCLAQLEFEQDLLKRYCPFSQTTLLNSIQELAIVQKAHDLAYQQNNGFLKMIVQKKYTEINQIYKLFSRVPKEYIQNFNKKVDLVIDKNKENQEKLKEKLEKINKSREKKIKKIKDDVNEKENNKLILMDQLEKQIDCQIKEANEQFQPTTEPEKKIHPVLHLKKILYEYIKDEGIKINRDSKLNEKATIYYQTICDLKEEIDNIINNYVQKDVDLTIAKDEGFKFVLNKFEKSGDFLAQFCDHFLHKDSCKNLTEEDIQRNINHIESFVYYIENKDVFFNLYEKYLSNRLLGNKVANSDNENQVIASFKKEHGAGSMKNCSKMIQDISQADEQNKNFHQYLKENEQTSKSILGDQFKTTVLQQACWPFDKEKEQEVVQIPQELQVCLDQFNAFYLKQNPNKKIDWNFKEGEANIQMLFGNKCTFTGSTYHMLFLLAFNVKDDWKVKEIRQYLQFNGSKTTQQIKQFTKLKLIKFDPPLKKDEKITGDHTIKLQLGFKTEKRRIQLNVIRKVEDRQVEKVSNSDIDQNREIIIEANIVRIMKGKRTLNFQDLQGEVIKFTKLFTPEIKMIKRKIEGLIDKEFLKRDTENPTVLIYIP